MSQKVYWETVNQPGHFILKAGMGAMITDHSDLFLKFGPFGILKAIMLRNDFQTH